MAEQGGDGGGGEAMNPGAEGGGDGYGMGSTVYTLKQSVVCRVGFNFVCFLQTPRPSLVSSPE